MTFLLPPLEQVYADEVPDTATEDVIPVSELIENEVEFSEPVEIESAVTSETESTNEAQAVDDVTAESSDGPPVVVDDIENLATTTIEKTAPTNETISSSTDEQAENSEETTTTPPEEGITSDEVASSTDEVEEVNNDEEIIETSNEETGSDEEVAPDENASSTDEAAASALTESVHFNDSNRFQFSVDECVGVGEGAFYCSALQATSTEPAKDAVFAATDADGDMEIFVRVGGEEVQITNNVYDDGAPFYAEDENRVVWHSLVNDRYQIMSYDIDTNRTLQLTDSPFNNMEPIMVGDQILWQAWIQNNWEIVLYDGSEIRQLTNNNVHDVSPSIKDEYVMWQTQFSDGWKVTVYNLKTEKIDVVDVESLSGTLENPRLVLLLDHVDENGVRQMVGYDLETKQPVELAAIPAPLPEELPEPDQTGEERAFVQSKPTLKETEEGTTNTDTDLDTHKDNPVTDLSTAAGTTPSTLASGTDLVIAPYIASSTEPAVVTETVVAPVVLPSDVVIPPFSSSTEPAVE